MATHHAAPREIVNLESWANDLPIEQSKTIARTEDMELARLVLPAGKLLNEHKVSGPVIIQCVKGQIIIRAKDSKMTLTDNQLLYLPPEELHSLHALNYSVVLLTIIFKSRE